MCESIAEKERQVVDSIRLIESDPRFAAIREVSTDLDRIAGEAIE